MITSQPKPKVRMVTLITIGLVVVGTLAVLAVGLLHLGFAHSTTSRPATSSKGVSAPPVGIAIGNIAPDFTLTLLDGKPVKLSDYRGKPVMLNFWSPTCSSCRAETPGVEKFYTSQQVGAVILGVDILNNFQSAKQFVLRYDLTYPVGLDSGSLVSTLYHVTGTPTSYFIDRQGIIRSIQIGPLNAFWLTHYMPSIS